MAVRNISLLDLGIKLFENEFEPDFKGVPTDNPYTEKGTPRTTEGKIASAPYYGIKAGREYYMPVIMTYEEAGTEKTIELPYPLVSLQTRKRFVETPLTERDGTVKEFISIDAYEFLIRGFIVGENGEFPEADLITLSALYKKKVPIEIKNVITDIFLVEPGQKPLVTIVDMRVPEREGVKHVREYQMVVVSDVPFSLLEIE